MSVSTTPPPLSTAQMQHYEYHAKKLRERAGLTALEPFDPFEYLEVFEVIAKYPDDFDVMPDELLEAIEQHSARDWSAISDKLPNGKLFVLLNRNQTRERMNVTLLEEMAHQHFGHEKTVIGIGGRQKYNAAQEQEARFTAASALSSKIHVIVDALGNPLRLCLSAGQRHDVTQAKDLLAGYTSERVIGDKAYDSQDLLLTLAEMGSGSLETASRDIEVVAY